MIQSRRERINEAQARKKGSPDRMTMSSLLILVSLCCGLLRPAAAASAQDCLSFARDVLSRNSPEILLLPDDNGYNAFVSKNVRVGVDWSHIDGLLDRSCVQSYLLEYRQYNYYDEEAHRLTKRETVSTGAKISPPIPADGKQSSFAISIPDDCEVYSVQLAVVTSGGDLLQSQPRRFWPVAHKAEIESYSDSLLLSWSPICAHKTSGWRLEICAESADDCTVQTLRSESPLQLSDLPACTSFQLRLLARTDSEDMLWMFGEARTLPKPKFDLKPGHDKVQLRILQRDCKPKDRVLYWRITHCPHRPDHPQRKLFGDVDQENDGEYTLDLGREDGSGDGSDINTDLDEEYYYYDQGGSTTPTCINTHHNVSSGDAAANSGLSLDGLSRCTMYTVDFTPTDAAGETLQPGEQYGTIVSTLCGDGDEDDAHDRDEELSAEDENSFWFPTDDEAKKESVGVAASSGGDLLPLLIVAGFIGSLLVAVLVAFLSWLAWHYVVTGRKGGSGASKAGDLSCKTRNSGIGGSEVDECEEEDRSLISSPRLTAVKS